MFDNLFTSLSAVQKAVCSQVFGGILFAIFGGTPQIVLLATAPLALYTQSKSEF